MLPRGWGKVFTDQDPGLNRYVAGKFSRALQRDLDAVVESGAGGQSREILESLTTARNNYRANSEAINEIRNTALGRVTKSKEMGDVIELSLIHI